MLVLPPTLSILKSLVDTKYFPSSNHAKVTGRSPFRMTQLACARSPSENVVEPKSIGNIWGGSVIFKQGLVALDILIIHKWNREKVKEYLKKRRKPLKSYPMFIKAL